MRVKPTDHLDRDGTPNSRTEAAPLTTPDSDRPTDLEFFDLDFTEPVVAKQGATTASAEFVANRAAPIRHRDALILALEWQRQPISKIGEQLLAEGHITGQQLEHALALQNNAREKRLGDILQEQGIVSRELIEELLCRRLGVPVIDLRQIGIELEALSLIPKQVAQRHKMMPCLLHRGQLVVASHNLPGHDILSELHFVSRRHIALIKAAKQDIEWAIERHYRHDAWGISQ